MSKKFLFAMLAAALIAGVSTGCGEKTENSDKAGAGKASEKSDAASLREKKAKRDAAKVDINNLGQQVELFRLHVGRCPEEWQELITRPEENEDWSGPYLIKEPVDPWGKKYIYRRINDESLGYEIISCGPDGTEGTEDDIKSFASSE